MREKVRAVLGEVPGQGTVYRQGAVVTGESSYIRERARALGMSLTELAERVGVSYGHMSQVSRGHRNMGVRVQARMEAALEAPAKVAPAECAAIDAQILWERMNAHGFSQNEVARRAGISSSLLSQIMNGKSSPSPDVLKSLHGVLFRRSRSEERVMPAELKVLGWRKGERQGIVVHGAGRLSVMPVVMPGYSAMLTQPLRDAGREGHHDAVSLPARRCMRPFLRFGRRWSHRLSL